MVRREPFFKQTPDPVASRWVIGAAPRLPVRSACSLSYRQVPQLCVHVAPDSSATSSLLEHCGTKLHLYLSFPSNNDQHYFSEQTVKGALERLGGVGWIGGSSTHLGLPCPSPSSWWCPRISSCELSLARAGLCIERIVAMMQLRPGWQQSQHADFRMVSDASLPERAAAVPKHELLEGPPSPARLSF